MIFSDSGALRRYMTAPCGWNEIEDPEEKASMIPTRILSELPIAMQEGGPSLHQLAVDSSPIFRELCKLRFRSTIKQNLETPGRDNQMLNYAYRDLEAFRFTQASDILAVQNRQPLRAKRRHLFEQYLLNVLSSRKLRYVCIDLSGLGCHDVFNLLADYYPLGPDFRFSNWPHLRSLCFSSISLDQDSLESLCRAPRPNLCSFSFHYVKLNEGHSSNALDILRDTLRVGCTQERCTVVFNCLSGGEFEKEECKAIDRMDRTWLHRKGWEFDEGDSIPVQLARMYVRNAAMTQNPLRADMEQTILGDPPSYLEKT